MRNHAISSPMLMTVDQASMLRIVASVIIFPPLLSSHLKKNLLVSGAGELFLIFSGSLSPSHLSTTKQRMPLEFNSAENSSASFKVSKAPAYKYFLPLSP
jgi:hypothetical protein